MTTTGEILPKEGFGASYFWWNYKTTLALWTDGEIVAFETSEGGVSPNYDPTEGVRPASDDMLSYPDAVRWEDYESRDEPPARTIIDRRRRPVEYGEPPGAGIRQALDTVRTQRPSPQQLGRTVVTTPPPQLNKSFLQRLFGG